MRHFFRHITKLQQNLFRQNKGRQSLKNCPLKWYNNETISTKSKQVKKISAKIEATTEHTHNLRPPKD